MSVEFFLDSNVLIYAISVDAREAAKRKRAMEIIGARGFGLSAQVLQEFFVVATRKIAVPMAPAKARDWLEQLDDCLCLALDRNLVKLGIAVSMRYQISYWDGAIVAAAETMGARILYTEDLNHGQKYGAVLAVDPFK